MTSGRRAPLLSRSSPPALVAQPLRSARTRPRRCRCCRSADLLELHRFELLSHLSETRVELRLDKWITLERVRFPHLDWRAVALLLDRVNEVPRLAEDPELGSLPEDDPEDA